MIQTDDLFPGDVYDRNSRTRNEKFTLYLALVRFFKFVLKPFPIVINRFYREKFNLFY